VHMAVGRQDNKFPRVGLLALFWHMFAEHASLETVGDLWANTGYESYGAPFSILLTMT